MVNTPQNLYMSFAYGILVVNMPVGMFRGISLRKEVYEHILRYIREHPEKGYKNVSQFVTDAIRRRFEELQRQGGEKA